MGGKRYVGIMPCNLEPEDGSASLFVNRTDNMREINRGVVGGSNRTVLQYDYT